MTKQASSSDVQHLDHCLRWLEARLLAVYGPADVGALSASPPRSRSRLTGILGTWQVRVGATGESYLVAG